jgi:hypothetical protein
VGFFVPQPKRGEKANTNTPNDTDTACLFVFFTGVAWLWLCFVFVGLVSLPPKTGVEMITTKEHIL